MSKRRNLFNIYYLKTYLCIYKYSYCILPTTSTNASKCDPHKYFYYLEPIYYGTLATHSMSSSFAPIFGDEEVKTAISYIQPFKYTESVQIENSY